MDIQVDKDSSFSSSTCCLQLTLLFRYWFRNWFKFPSLYFHFPFILVHEHFVFSIFKERFFSFWLQNLYTKSFIIKLRLVSRNLLSLVSLSNCNWKMKWKRKRIENTIQSLFKSTRINAKFVTSTLAKMDIKVKHINKS